MTFRQSVLISNILIVTSVCLISCKASDLGINVGGSSPPVVEDEIDIEVVLGPLSDLYDLSEVVMYKGYLNSPTEYVSNLNADPALSESGFISDYWQNSITISPNLNNISVSFLNAHIVDTGIGPNQFVWDSDNDQMCTFQMVLTAEETAAFQQEIAKLNLCEVNGPNGIVYPDGGLFIEAAGNHSVIVKDLSSAEQRLDFIGAYLSGYSHRYVCGPQSILIGLLISKLSQNIQENGCPALPASFDPFVNNYRDW